MKITLISFFTLFICFNSIAQELKQIDAHIGQQLDFGSKAQQDWKRIDQLMSSGKDWSEFTEEESELISKYDAEVMENMWDVIGGACSWYCGAGEYGVQASSQLSSQGKNDYKTLNISDLNYKTAWVEGVDGDGIGEYIEFKFSPTHPRLTEIIIVNGYVKSKSAWKNNSRVKKMKMYLNNKPYAIINLKDVYAEQSFKVEPIGYSEREDINALKEKEPFLIKFEILEVYKGDKYNDTAITEIYFDGIDVH